MNDKWFSNRGQIIQVLCSGIAVILAGINAWPAVKNLEFLTFAPLLFYLVFAAFAVALVIWLHRASKRNSTNEYPTQPSQPIAWSDTNKSSDEFIVKPTYTKFKLSAGNYQEIPRGISPVKITLKDVKKFEARTKWVREKELFEGAELEINTGGFVLHAGVSVESIAINHFVCPAAKDAHDSEEGSLYAYVFADNYFSFFGIRIDHINMHAKEADITVVQASGIKRRP